MKRFLLAGLLVACGWQTSPAFADETTPVTDGGAETIPEAVRVTIWRLGGQDTVRSVSGGGGGSRSGCVWSLTYAPDLDDVPYGGTSPGPIPDPDARFALLLCDGQIMRPIWVSPSDVVDLDAIAATEAQRYIEDVLVPVVGIGVNPAAMGLVGLPSWFWVEGFGGSISAPPISALGLTIEVRMSSGSVHWDFGDGSSLDGDLGRAYPAESTVQHIHQHDGRYTVSATIDLVPQYRVDGGAWITLPNLVTNASTQHPVQQRQAVITRV